MCESVVIEDTNGDTVEIDISYNALLLDVQDSSTWTTGEAQLLLELPQAIELRDAIDKFIQILSKKRLT